MPQGYRSDVYGRAYAKRKPTTSSGGVTSSSTVGRGKTTNPSYGRPTPQYVERERRNVADDKLRAEVLRTLADSVKQQGAGKPGAPSPGAMGHFPQVPIEPTAGNPYKGVEAAIGRFAQASASRSKGDVKAARAALKGRADPAADIMGSFNAQAAGMAAENAAQVTSLKNAARAGYAEEQLRVRSESAKALFDARSQQIKSDTELMEQGAAGGLTLAMAQNLASEGLDPAKYVGNPMAASIDIGRARFARRRETGGIPATAWAQAAQYGLQPPNTYNTYEDFQWALGQAKGGMYGVGSGGDFNSFMQFAMQSGLLKGIEGQGG